MTDNTEHKGFNVDALSPEMLLIFGDLVPWLMSISDKEKSYVAHSMLHRICFTAFKDQELRLRPRLLGYLPTDEDDYVNKALAVACADSGDKERFNVQPGKVFKRTLQRLKDKGVYCKNLKAIYDKMDQDDPKYRTRNGQDLTLLSRSLCMLAGTLSTSQNPNAELPDSAWYAGIEMSMLLIAPDQFCDNSVTNYASYLDGCEPILYLYTLLAFLAFSFVDTADEKLEAIKTCYSNLKEFEEISQIKNVVVELSNENETLKKERALSLSDRETCLQEQRDRYEKEVLALKHKLADSERESEKTISALQSEVDYLMQSRITDNAEATMTEEELRAKETREDETYADIELPSENVLFVGGHTNMLNKLVQVHPEWDFVNDSEFKPKDSFTKKYSIAFCWTGHMSHRLFERASICLDDNCEFIYLTATNLDRLETEMKMGYAQRHAKPKEGEGVCGEPSDT